MTMIAHSQGGISSTSECGGSLGVDYHTVAHWLDVLEGVFLVRRLRPYFANISKRLVKSPKVYIRDTGLLHLLLGLDWVKKPLLMHPKVGVSYETFCIEQLVHHALLADPTSEAFFVRTQTGLEVDLLLKLRGKLVPIEIKLGTAVPNTRGLHTLQADLSLAHGYVVTSGDAVVPLSPSITMAPLTEVMARLSIGQ
jgi:uncharacterized protein